jgi:tol-pal system protein YbgF
MSRFSRILALASLALAVLLGGCNTYAYLPTRSRSAPPPEAAPAPAPPPAVATEAYRPGEAEHWHALEMRLQQMEKRLARLEQARPDRMAVPESPPTLARETAPPAAAPLATPAFPEPPTDHSAEYPLETEADPEVDAANFPEGMALYRDNKFEAARQKFYQYLRNNPHGPKASEARYYLGDSFYREKRYREAAVEFNKLVTLHPDSVLAPSALLRQALSYEQMEQQSNYRLALQRLVEDFPGSPEAQEARKRLGEAI